MEIQILDQVYLDIKEKTLIRAKNTPGKIKGEDYIIADLFMYWSNKFIKYLFVKEFIEYDVFAELLQNLYHLNSRNTHFPNFENRCVYTSKEVFQRGVNDIEYDDILKRIETRHLLRTLYVVEKAKGDIITNKHGEKLKLILDIMKNECEKRGVDLNNFNYRDYLPDNVNMVCMIKRESTKE